MTLKITAVLIAAFLLPAFGCLAQTGPVPDQLKPVWTSHITGFPAQRFNDAYSNRILAQDINRLVEPFKNRTETRYWQSEFWGKWFTSAVLAYRYRPELRLRKVLDDAVAKLIATQSDDGYIGNYEEKSRLEQWDIWGRKYCLLGLLAYHDLTGDARSLKAAQAMADHLIRELKDHNVPIVRKGNHRGMAASSVLEPICLLYNKTGEERYLAFAEEIVKQWESENGPQLISRAGIEVGKRFPQPRHWFGWEQGQKAYEMMSCYEGLIELYRITGKPGYKLAVEKTWESIYQTEINVAGSGSSVECWFGGKDLQALPINHYQETCVTATWIKLNQQLLRLTGAAKYADAIEQAFYNALLGAMKPDGSDWAKYSPLAGHRLEGSEQCGMGLNCCVASGPRGLFTLPSTSVMQRINGIQVNFFIPGNYTFQTPAKQQAELMQQTEYPITGKVNFSLKLKRAEQFSISIRIPSWSNETQLKVNGQIVSAIVAGQYAQISRKWTSGDIITLDLDMQGHIVYQGVQPTNFAILRGPIVLARDMRLGGPHVDDALTPILNQAGSIDLQPLEGSNNDFLMKFKADFKIESHKEGPNEPVSLTLADYASAGNTGNEFSRFRVWLPKLFDPKDQK
ncbi:glycoside hydrolase family 127 protein [Pedobacter africanus]|uniref:DUF1680 family protein n=1 Tax=Pedobacter africanus TaxID=151894 RepID=A0A1W2AR79_9SPHI|nr:beta-L-arabinofuranosidase domain-containing protein [Pedobacter africanus]SMC63216.1 hypothetical protein SAMN04488524_1603 [Pedobacter africanus]